MNNENNKNSNRNENINKNLNKDKNLIRNKNISNSVNSNRNINKNAKTNLNDKRDNSVSQKEEMIEITSLNSEGQGVGRINQKAVFVDGAIPGDTLSINILHDSKTYSIGKITKLLTPSPDRISPACSVTRRCGGCSLQFMEYKAQCQWKKDGVIQALIRIGGFQREDIENITSEILGMKDPFFYRNKIQLPIGGNSAQPQIGFYENNSHEIVDSDTCIVQHPVADSIRKAIREFIASNKLSIYDEKKHEGLIRHLVIRLGFNTKDLMVIIVLARKDLSFKNKLLEALKTAVSPFEFALKSIYFNINDQKTNLVLGKELVLLDGQKYIEEILNGIRYRISPFAFFQVNTVQAEVLYSKVIEFADMKSTDIVFDLYCGTGSISLALAKYCKKVIGVEIVKEAISDAMENAKINNIENCEFTVGKAEEVFPKYLAKGINADLIVIDPPRKGLDQALIDSLIQMSPPEIVYVSCNPATLARDCKILCSTGGYKLMAIQPVDMFPHTGHVETIILMTRSGSGDKK